MAVPEIRDKLKTLMGTGEDYVTAVQKLKEDLLPDQPNNFSFHKHLISRERKRIDCFALRVRQDHRRIDTVQ